MALIEKLNAIGDAIRAKNGSEDKYTLDGMVTAIGAIETGGGGEEYFTDEELVFTGNLSYLFSHNKWKNILEKEKSRIKIKNPSNITSVFQASDIEDFSYITIEGDGKTACPATSLFGDCYNLKKLPKINNIYINANQSSGIFNYMYNFTDADELIKFYDNCTFSNATMQGFSLGGNMYSLRNIDAVMPYIKKAYANYASGANYGAFCYNYYALDEINNIPILGGTRTSNGFSQTFNNTARVKNITFETNEDGTPIIAQWKSQTIDLVTYNAPVGVFYNSYPISYLTGYSSGITAADKAPTADFQTFSAFIEANPDNWWTDDVYWSRYGKTSAINTINSLPDTSAYLASAGGTNTIKFKGVAGSSRGDRINSMSAEEIAVATAKGWTVTFA